MNLRACLDFYLRKWWCPGAITILFLLLPFLLNLANFFLFSSSFLKPLVFLNLALRLLFIVSLFGILVAATYHLIRKQWRSALLQFAIFAGLIAAIAGLAFFLIKSLFGPSEDHFADHLTIPAELAVTDPLPQLDAPGTGDDAFQAALVASLQTSGTDDASVTASLPALAELQARAPGILRRYLATSIAWRVFRERDQTFATRRWQIGEAWTYTLNGYYTHFTFDRVQKQLPPFQSRLTLGLTGQPWSRRQLNRTDLAENQSQSVTLSIQNGQPGSDCFLPVNGILVEIFEQSAKPERRLTKAALTFLQNELQPLAADPTWATIQKIVPPGSIKTGSPDFALRNSFQPGIYTSEIRVNPGEPGSIYLKAFEATRHTPLSADALKKSSTEFIGWSDDPSQQFYANANLMIYEGDWDKPYAATFEVWFTPDSGQPDRKLLEKTFRIEGWQR